MYIDLYVDSFESSNEYNRITSSVETGMSLYNPEFIFDKTTRVLTINITADSDVEDALIFYPGIAKPIWNQIIKTINDITKRCYDLVSEYEIKIILKMCGKRSQYLILLESENGKTTFNILE